MSMVTWCVRSSGWRRLVAGLATLAVAALLPAVVGDGAGAAQATGEPLVLGSVGTYSTEQQAGESPGDETIEAWAEWVNAHGGVNGHPVKLIVKDNRLDQAQAVSMVKELVEQDGVVAFVSNQDGQPERGLRRLPEGEGNPGARRQRVHARAVDQRTRCSSRRG